MSEVTKVGNHPKLDLAIAAAIDDCGDPLAQENLPYLYEAVADAGFCIVPQTQAATIERYELALEKRCVGMDESDVLELLIEYHDDLVSRGWDEKAMEIEAVIAKHKDQHIVACAECGGAGFIDLEMPECCGNLLPHGECCGNAVAGHRRESCEFCWGTGQRYEHRSKGDEFGYAQMIAAAPKMLAALKDAERALGALIGPPGTLARVRAAIRLAEGLDVLSWGRLHAHEHRSKDGE